jgi:hypothetical protein
MLFTLARDGGGPMAKPKYDLDDEGFKKRLAEEVSEYEEQVQELRKIIKGSQWRLEAALAMLEILRKPTHGVLATRWRGYIMEKRSDATTHGILD